MLPRAHKRQVVKKITSGIMGDFLDQTPFLSPQSIERNNTHFHFVDCTSTQYTKLIDCIKLLRHTRHKIGYYGDGLPS